MKKPELLAPAGDMEKLKFALLYGADAVYLAGKQLGLRASAGNFTPGEMQEGVNYAHSLDKKVYVTVNILAHNDDLEGLEAYLQSLDAMKVDGIIVSDLGIVKIAREIAPQLPIHLSTQANTTNWAAAEFWKSYGIKRIVLARELSLKEITEITTKVDIDIETFIHGAMCMAYSGRCLLSNFLVGRGANQGECAQPCRYKYYLVEDKRKDRVMEIQEDTRGSYIFNSKDLCMLAHIPEMINAGIKSLKIEGRMKSVHYVATVVKAYRMAIDSYFQNPQEYIFDRSLLEEVTKVSHREYTTGFYFKKISSEDHNYNTSTYKHNYDFIGIVLGYDNADGMIIVEQRNNFGVGETVEFCPPQGASLEITVTEMYDRNKEKIEKAPHPQQLVYITWPRAYPENTLIRRRKR
ncbi:MAG: peptidase U32 [Desulfitibacter sp. BRH_c19]|nr:MAG: peptidase U32 [Desulfitibacter sp. BRH_c19]